MTENSGKQDEGSACGCGGGSCCSGPGRWIWIVLCVAMAGVLIAKNVGKKDVSARTPVESDTSAAVEAGGTPGAQEPATHGEAIPRLVDLGATKCIPCKMMAPILEDLKKTYAGKLEVQFIDVWKNPDAGDKFGLKVIPTQIFYDASGKELFRHEGFFGKDEILAAWRKFGVDLEGAGNPAESPRNNRAVE